LRECRLRRDGGGAYGDSKERADRFADANHLEYKYRLVGEFFEIRFGEGIQASRAE
jgi:hypothetical protein